MESGGKRGESFHEGCVLLEDKLTKIYDDVKISVFFGRTNGYLVGKKMRWISTFYRTDIFIK